jgi:60 kDa SS-A/Ro ribonucleoprotein
VARTNVKRKAPAYEGVTHEGAPAVRINELEKLKRSVMSCLLWEDEFYEDGEKIADRIVKLVAKVPASSVATLAIQARNQFKLRHVPLLLTAALCKHASGTRLVSDTVPLVVRRVDELAELVSIYRKLNGKDAALANQLKKGLAQAFRNFDEYQFAKYDRDGDWKVRDVMFMVHPGEHLRLEDGADVALATDRKDYFRSHVKRHPLFRRVAERNLKTPDTWEVELSAGKDKKETFERLLKENRLGYLALLRNLRNMEQAGVDRDLIEKAILARKGAQNVLPFRYLAAARHAPSLEPALDQALSEAIAEIPPFEGTTVILVDVSGSMDDRLAGKSDLKRVDAAATLAAIFPGKTRVITFSERHVEVPPRKGMAGVAAILASQPHSGTYLGKAVTHANTLPHDRLIVITDEQTADRVPDPKAKHAYVINVASAQNGIGYRKSWVHIDGFSEQVIRFIREYELG